MVSKAGLGVVLSRLKVFVDPKVRVEQYPTDPEIAAFVLWQAHLIGDLGKVSVDFGCGTGILGIGASLLGAQKVYFVESDSSALKKAKDNWNNVKSEHSVDCEAVFLCSDISKFNEKVDVVLENPPFGTKVRHSDRVFLEKAVKVGKVVYSFHKSESKGFIEKFCVKNNCKVTHVWDFKFPLKAVHGFHTRKLHRINVSCFRICVN